MVASLEKLLRESGLTFTKQFHVPRIGHVLNLSFQGGLKELGNSSFTSFFQKIRVMKSVKKIKWKLSHKEHLAQFFISFENLFLRKIVHHKNFISIRNYARGIKCQIETY